MELYRGPARSDMLHQANTYVLDDGLYLGFDKSGCLPDGHTIMGIPFVKDLPGWAFNRTEEQIERYCNLVGKADIVVAHSPPHNCLDTWPALDELTPPDQVYLHTMLAGKRSHYGSKAILQYVLKTKPKIFICGHVHEGYGTFDNGHTKFYNVAMCDRRYKPVNPPVVIDI